jgi:hypothetical protein
MQTYIKSKIEQKSLLKPRGLNGRFDKKIGSRRVLLSHESPIETDKGKYFLRLVLLFENGVLG